MNKMKERYKKLNYISPKLYISILLLCMIAIIPAGMNAFEIAKNILLVDFLLIIIWLVIDFLMKKAFKSFILEACKTGVNLRAFYGVRLKIPTELMGWPINGIFVEKIGTECFNVYVSYNAKRDSLTPPTTLTAALYDMHCNHIKPSKINCMSVEAISNIINIV